MAFSAVRQRSSHAAPRWLLARCVTSSTGIGQTVPLPPGPKPWPLVGNMFNADLKQLVSLGGMKSLYDEYGPMVHLRLPGTELVYISDVHLQREILTKKAASFTNGDVFRLVFGHFFPTSVIVVEGDQWKRIRKVIQRAIQGTRIGDAIAPLHLVACRADEAFIEAGKAVDVHGLACGVTLDSFGFWAYNVDFNTIGGENPEILASCNAIAEVLQKRIRKPFPFLWKLPTKENREAKQGLATLHAHAGKLLDERMDMHLGEGSQRDLLAALVAASRAEAEPKDGMTRDEMLDNIGTIFFGAYDTTSATIAFTLNFLAAHPSAQETLAAELKGHDLATITMEEFDDLPYLDMVCRESNRLCPTAGAFARTAKEDVQIGSYLVRKGATCVIDHLTLPAQNPELWGGQTDLADFRPERWGEVKPHRLASLPFGFGGRICPGSQLATLEHKFITSYLMQRYSWSLDADRPMKVTMKVGYCPEDGCWLVPEARV